MRAYTSMIFAGASLIAFGAGYDIGGADGNGDQTVPHVPTATVAASGASTISIASSSYPNYITGDEYRVPPPGQQQSTIVSADYVQKLLLSSRRYLRVADPNDAA